MPDANNDYPTILGTDASFKGQLNFEKGVRLLGTFDGEINSKGELLIEDGAKLSGDVHAGTIRVEGQVKGNLQADAKVQLTASGKLEGDIQTARLEVADGAVLMGRCMVGPQEGVRETAGATTSTAAPAGATTSTAAPAGVTSPPPARPKAAQVPVGLKK